MPGKRYVFGEGAVRRISRAVRRSERGRQEPPAVAVQGIHTKVYVCKTPAGGIPAMTGDTPGSAECTVYRFDADDVLEAVTDRNGDDVTITVKNLADEAVAGETYIQTKQESVSARNLADFEVC